MRRPDLFSFLGGGGRRGATTRPSLLGSGVIVLAVAALCVGAPGSGVIAAPGDPGSLAGRVLDASGDPLPSICVGVSGGPTTVTDTDGRYQVDGVEPGQHTVVFDDCADPPTHATTWYLNRGYGESPDPVIVVSDAVVPLADVTMPDGVAVSGTVTDGSGNPLAGINVNVNPYNGNGPSTGAQTDVDGTYRTRPLPAGQYRVQFNDPQAIWATEYWSEQILWHRADVLALSLDGGPEHGDVDATLAAAATITGVVTNTAGGPLAGICVNANTPDQQGFAWVAGSNTQADGTYTLTGVPPGTDVRINFHDCNRTATYIDEWYDDARFGETSTALVLSPGEARSGVDAQLAAGIRVAGTVTDTDGNPLAGITVNVNPYDAQGISGWASTDVNGRYATTPVPPGSYRVQFRDDAQPALRESRYWDQQTSYNAADRLQLTAADGPQRDGVDARLAVAASISGTITGPDGPAGGVCVTLVVETANGPNGIDQVLTAADGTYTFFRLSAGLFKVLVQDCNIVGPYGTRWYSSATSIDAAATIDLQPGEQRPGVDVQLPAAATIVGTVTDQAAQPLPGICVQAVTATAFGALTRTDGEGRYQLLVEPTGEFTVQFVDCTENPIHAGQSTTVTVASGEPPYRVDAILALGATATLTGSVRNGDGVPMTTACVVVYLPNEYALFVPVNADGSFSVTNIPSGTYAVGFLGGCDQPNGPSPTVVDPVDSTRTYQAQWWQGVDLLLSRSAQGGPDPIAQGATLVAIGPGQQLTGFDVCFGCQPPSTSTTTTSTTTTAPPTTAPPPGGSRVEIVITGHTRLTGTITLAFAASETAALGSRRAVAQAVLDGAVYTTTCSTPSGPDRSAQGAGSALTVAGVIDRATYACEVVATVDGTVVGTSAVVIVDPLLIGTLPRTGSAPLRTTWTAAGALLVGALLVGAVRRSRWRHS